MVIGPHAGFVTEEYPHPLSFGLVGNRRVVLAPPAPYQDRIALGLGLVAMLIHSTIDYSMQIPASGVLFFAVWGAPLVVAHLFSRTPLASPRQRTHAR